VTEMRWLFPKAERNPHHYIEPPIDRCLYFAAGKRQLDTVKLFLETRCRELRMLRHKREAVGSANVPLVVNLLHVSDASAQVEAVTSLMVMGLLKDRRSVVLVENLPKDSYVDVLPDTCRLVTAHSQAIRWIGGLREPDSPAGSSEALSVA
jgi:hypothetical protein